MFLGRVRNNRENKLKSQRSKGEHNSIRSKSEMVLSSNENKVILLFFGSSSKNSISKNFIKETLVVLEGLHSPKDI